MRLGFQNQLSKPSIVSISKSEVLARQLTLAGNSQKNYAVGLLDVCSYKTLDESDVT